jgi:hypothetical protein
MEGGDQVGSSGCQETTRGVLRPQEHLNALAKLRIVTALAIKDRQSCGGALLFSGLEEYGLNTLGIDRHGITPKITFPHSSVRH